jgi:hypothetical protein
MAGCGGATERFIVPCSQRNAIFVKVTDDL